MQVVNSGIRPFPTHIMAEGPISGIRGLYHGNLSNLRYLFTIGPMFVHFYRFGEGISVFLDNPSVKEVCCRFQNQSTPLTENPSILR